MAGTIKGIIVEIGGDTSGLQNALKNVNSATSSLSKELRGVNSLLKLDPTNTELLSQKQTILSQSIQETSEKLRILKQTQEQADSAIANGTKVSDENYRNLQREIINTENKLKDLQLQASKWTQAGKAIEKFGNKISNTSKKLDTLGGTLTTTLTLPVLAVGTAAITTGNNFEAQMSRVQAIAGATGEELEKLTEQAMMLGAETSFSATEVAQGMENLASAGFTTEEIMEAMPGLLDLAASSGAELATSSEIAASAIRGFGLEASEAVHVADVFAEASARTNAQTEDMGNAMKYIAPVANTMGLKIEEVAAAIGIMSDAGIKGEQAGTTLRGALTRLTKPTEKMIGVMENLGISFYDNEGKMKSLTEIISMLQDATKDLTNEQEQNALTTLFGTESLSGMVALINRGSKDLEDMTKSFENCDGSASDMADTMLDNTSGALESLSGSIETTGIAIQKALTPEIKKSAKWIQDLVDDFSNLSEEQQLNIIKMAGLVVAIGPTIKIISKLSGIIGTATKGIGLVSQAIKVLATNTQSSSDSVNKLASNFKKLASPAGIVTATLTAVAIGVELVNQKVQEELKSTTELIEQLQSATETRKSSTEAIENQRDASLAEIDNVKMLRDELSTLVDENGKVKEGYEARAQFILNELNEALGTEYKLNDNIIKSYEKMQDSIDELILKKKAQLILEADEEAYQEAIHNKTQAMQDYLSAQDELNKLLPEYNKLAEEQKRGFIGSEYSLVEASTKMKEYGERIQELKTNINEQDRLLKQYNDSIVRYNENSELMIEGGAENYKKIEQSVAITQANITASANAGIAERINNQIQANAETKRLYDLETQYNKDAKDSIYATNVEEGKKQLQLLADDLIARTSTVSDLGENEVSAWKNLANNAYDEYNYALGKMPVETRKKIEEMTGVISKNTSVEEATIGIARKVESGFNDNVDPETWGKDLVQLLTKGASNINAINGLKGTITGIADMIRRILGFSVPEEGPLSNFDKSMPDMIDLMTKGIDNNSYKLENSAKRLATKLNSTLNSELLLNYSKLQGQLSSQVINSSKTIFTTPQIIFNVQELDEAKLQQCFNYVNRKFGSQY